MNAIGGTRTSASNDVFDGIKTEASASSFIFVSRVKMDTPYHTLRLDQLFEVAEALDVNFNFKQ